MNEEENYIEKRRFGRLATKREIQYRKIGSPRSGSLSYDISGGGLRLLSLEFIPLATKLLVEIPLEYPMKTINALAHVVWVKKRSFAEQYDLGLEFVDISSEDQKDLVNYVERNLVHERIA